MSKILTCDRCGGSTFHVNRTEICELDNGVHETKEVTIYDCHNCGGTTATWREEK